MRLRALPSWSWRVAVAAIALALLWSTFHHVEVRRVGVLLRSTGPLVGLTILVYLLPILSDTLGWQRLLAVIGERVPLPRLLTVRLSLDALQMTLPGGSVLSETMTPTLLKARCSVPVAHALASSAARKCLFGLTQALFLIVAAVCGREQLDAVSRDARVPWLFRIFVASALALFTVSASALWLLRSRNMGAKLRRGLQVIPFERLRAFLGAQEAGFDRFDLGTTRLFRLAHLGSVAPAIGAIWFLQAFDTWFLLRLLGAPMGFAAALPMEAGVSILRMAGAAIPGALGVQEAGYVAFIAIAGVADPTMIGAAFAILKRAREAFWIAVGYVFLAYGKVSVAAPQPCAELAIVGSPDGAA